MSRVCIKTTNEELIDIMNIPKLFIFDMDGTMFDTEPISYRAWQTVCKPYGYDIPEELFISIIGMDNRRIIQKFRDYFGPAFPHKDIWEKKTAWQLQYYQDHMVPLKHGLWECLHFAKERGIQCAVASSSPREQIEKLVTKSGLSSYFQIIQSGQEVIHGKPAPDIFLTVLKRAGVAPEDALVLEDSENGILAAVAAQIPAVWIPDLVRISPETQQKAVCTCQSLRELLTLF